MPTGMCNGGPGLKSNLQSFAEKCTLHGVYDIMTSQNAYLRLFWIAAFGCALGVAAYECAVIVMQYYDSPVVVSYLVVESRGLSLPDVVVCPFNRFNRTFITVQNISHGLARYLEIGMGLARFYEFQQEYANSDEFEAIHTNKTFQLELDDLLYRLNISYAELLGRVGISCEALVPYCIMRGARSDCCRTATSLQTAQGRCHRISGDEQSAAGYGHGITLFMKIPQEIYYPSISNIHNDGVFIKLADKSRGVDADMTFVPSGSHALMPLRITRYDFMNDPPRYTCFSDLPSNYSRVQCFDTCAFEQAAKICGCSNPGSNYESFGPPCRPHEYYGCLVKKTVEYVNNVTQEVFHRNCRERCKPSCNYTQYTSSVSYAKFPSPTIRDFLRDEAQWKEYQSNIILDIFYEHMEYTLIEHHASMTADTFIANLGGQIGLWVGGSILTVLQLLVFLVQCASIPFHPRRAQDDQTENRNGGPIYDSDNIISHPDLLESQI